MNHERQRLRISEVPQGTERPRVSREHLRDALGEYPAHARLEASPTGRAILEAAADIQSALVDAMSDRTSTAWSERSGFRSPGDVRKLKSGEHVGTMTDAAVLKATDRAAFVRFVEALAQLAGGRFEPLKADPEAIAKSIARLGVSAAEVSASYLTATAPDGPAGEQLATEEVRGIRGTLSTLKKLAAEVEAALPEASAE